MGPSSNSICQPDRARISATCNLPPKRVRFGAHDQAQSPIRYTCIRLLPVTASATSVSAEPVGGQPPPGAMPAKATNLRKIAMFFFQEGFTYRNFLMDVVAIFAFVVWFWLLVIIYGDL